MRSRCMSLLPRTTLHSDSEQFSPTYFLEKVWLSRIHYRWHPCQQGRKSRSPGKKLKRRICKYKELIVYRRNGFRSERTVIGLSLDMYVIVFVYLTDIAKRLRFDSATVWQICRRMSGVLGNSLPNSSKGIGFSLQNALGFQRVVSSLGLARG
jgi:hypothetical protein